MSVSTLTNSLPGVMHLISPGLAVAGRAVMAYVCNVSIACNSFDVQAAAQSYICLLVGDVHKHWFSNSGNPKITLAKHVATV